MPRILKIIQRLDAISYFISKASAIFSAFLISLTTVVIFAYVINRSFIGHVWLFVEEWSSMVLVAISYFGMAYTLRHNKHIYVDIIISRLKPKTKNTIEFIIAIFCLIVLGFMIERSINWLSYTIQGNIRSSGPMRTPMWIPTITMVIGLILYFVDMVFYLLKRFFSLLGKELNLVFYE